VTDGGPEGGETDLGRLLAGMRPALDPGTEWVFCVVPGGAPPDAALEPVAMVREAEGWTAVVPRERAARAGLPYEGTFRRITLTVHSSLAAVGFLAAVAGALAAAGIPCNAVSGAYHDHLFVPTGRADDAIAVLSALSAPRGAATPGG
jgi:hypothetical protein